MLNIISVKPVSLISASTYGLLLAFKMLEISYVFTIWDYLLYIYFSLCKVGKIRVYS